MFVWITPWLQMYPLHNSTRSRTQRRVHIMPRNLALSAGRLKACISGNALQKRCVETKPTPNMWNRTLKTSFRYPRKPLHYRVFTARAENVALPPHTEYHQREQTERRVSDHLYRWRRWWWWRRGSLWSRSPSELHELTAHDDPKISGAVSNQSQLSL